jgi:carboxyl-terminal processing protease
MVGDARAEPPPPAISDSASLDVAKLYDAVVQTVDKAFYDPKLLQELDWKTRANAVRPSVLAAPSTEDAVRQINGLLSELKTSHTALFTPDDYDYYALLDIVGLGRSGAGLTARRFWGNGPYYPGIGIFTRRIGEHHFVDGILEGSPADQAGLQYGDEILSVDGRLYSPIAAFRGKAGAHVSVELRRHAEAAPQRFDVTVIPIRPTTAFSMATEASARVIERNGRRIGYIHVWASHEADSFKAALAKLDPARSERRSSAAVSDDLLFRSGRNVTFSPLSSEDVERKAETDELKPVDSLIVDMRGRVGGNIGVAKAFLEAMDPDTRDYFGAWRYSARSTPNPGPSMRPREFRGRSALLINEHTRSAAEIMAFGYKHSAFGPIVGTQSAGAVSSGALFVMPGDMLLYVAVGGHTFDNQRIEGAGVTPDHRVEQPLPYAAGADPVLETAVELLAKQAPR